MSYIGELYIGTPPMQFTFEFDTFSSWTWLRHSSCKRKCGTNVRRFDPSKSSSYEGTNLTIEPEFVDGNGTLGYDNVRLSKEGPQVTRHPLVLMQNFTAAYDSNSDGIAVRAKQGLAFQASSEGSKTIVETLKEQGVIDKDVFAFYLAETSDHSKPQSSLSLGSYNLTKYALSNFSYIRLRNLSGFWVVTLNSFKVEKAEMPDSAPVIIVPTISGIGIPFGAYELYRFAVCRIVKCDPNYDGVSFECPNGEEESLPDIVFKLDNADFPLSYKHYISKEGNTCYDKISSHFGAIYILGNSFMRAYYTVFDKDNYRIGFARSINYPLVSRLSMWTVALIAAIAVALIAGAVVGYCLYRRKGLQAAEAAEPLMRQGQDF